MKFQTRPVEIEAYRVNSEDGRTILHQHPNAFASKNLWDCWDIRTPGDTIELATKSDWIAIDTDGGIYPIKIEDLLKNYTPLEAPTHCLKCGTPTEYGGVDALILLAKGGLCPNCTSHHGGPNP